VAAKVKLSELNRVIRISEFYAIYPAIKYRLYYI